MTARTRMRPSRKGALSGLPPPPDGDAARDEKLGDDQHGQVEDLERLVARQLGARRADAAAPDGDELLLADEPADGVQEEVAVQTELREVLVVGEARRADDDEARLVGRLLSLRRRRRRDAHVLQLRLDRDRD